MKKIIVLMLVLTVLLCGCSKEEKQDTVTTAPSQTQPSTEAPPKPDGDPETAYEQFYVAGSVVETASNGAVKEYDVGDCYGVLTFGDGLLLLSGDEDTTLTYVKPDGVQSEKNAKDCYLLPADITILPGNKVAYYDMLRNTVVVLDSMLTEVEQIALPDTNTCDPLVTADGNRIYYLTANELRYLDLKSGTDKMLKEINFTVQMLERLHFDDSVLECYTFQDDQIQTLLIDTQTGQMNYSIENMPVMETWGENYFAASYEGGFAQYLFGTREGTPSCLIAEGYVNMESVLLQSVVSCAELETSITLNYYDLISGAKTGAVELPVLCAPYGMAIDEASGEVWFLTLNEDDLSRLYCWNPALSETGDSTSCIAPYYTADDPDVEGLQQISEKAKEIGQKNGVRIRVHQDALTIEPSDYVFEAAYQVPLYQQYLDELETALAQYPEGFLKKLGTTSANGKITISLVAAAYGNNDLGSLDSADGVHFYNDGNVYIALVMGERFVPTLYHELFHSIDTYVLNQCNVFDDWEKLNPKGFEYDNDYVANQLREDYQYLGDDRWFIDMYSMSYPKEDRARIMEYAMELCNEEFFESANMQKKLSTLCKGIRTAFGLKKYSGELLWEQYLG